MERVTEQLERMEDIENDFRAKKLKFVDLTIDIRLCMLKMITAWMQTIRRASKKYSDDGKYLRVLHDLVGSIESSEISTLTRKKEEFEEIKSALANGMETLAGVLKIYERYSQKLASQNGSPDEGKDDETASDEGQEFVPALETHCSDEDSNGDEDRVNEVVKLLGQLGFAGQIQIFDMEDGEIRSMEI